MRQRKERRGDGLLFLQKSYAGLAGAAESEGTTVEEKTIELMEHRAMIYLPENSVEVTVIAKVFENGELQTVSMTYDMQKIREMFRKADDGYIDDDDVFVLTEKGKAFFEGDKTE